MRALPVVLGLRASHPWALRMAMRQALAGRTFVRVVHCCDPTMSAEGEQVLNSMRLRAEVDDRRSPPVGFELSPSGAVESLERAARAAQSLVVGCRDSQWFATLRTGDVVARLARHADSPVMVVPEGVTSIHGGDVVLLRAGGGDPGRGTLQVAFAQAAERGGTLRVEGHDRSGSLAAALARMKERHPGVQVEVTQELVAGLGDAGVIVVERPGDVSSPFAHSVEAPVATAIDRGCVVAVVPPLWEAMEHGWVTQM